MIVQLLSLKANTEHEEIKGKQQQGIEIANKKELYKGRPLKYSEDKRLIRDIMKLKLFY